MRYLISILAVSSGMAFGQCASAVCMNTVTLNGQPAIPGSVPSGALLLGTGSPFQVGGSSAWLAAPTGTNPNAIPNANFFTGLSGAQTFNSASTLNLGFTLESAMSGCNATQNPQPGRNLFGNGTNSKVTTQCYNDTLNCFAGGQCIAKNLSMYGGAPGDLGVRSEQVVCNGEVIAGDESSCGLTVVNHIGQQASLIKTTLTGGAVRSGCPSNMTFGQNVTASQTQQTVTVSSTTGCANGDWLVGGYAGATGFPNWDPIQIVSFTSTTVTAIYWANHSNGDAIGVATVIPVAGTCGLGSNSVCLGQQQWLVNLSGTSYSTGTAVAGGTGNRTMTGSGTAWTANIVGGDANTPGCFAFTGDDQTYSPFGAGSSAARSWFPIVPGSVTSGTALTLYAFSVTGAGFYAGVGSGAYQILPCAAILTWTGNTVVLSPNTFSWANGNTIEQRLAPDIDSTIENDLVHFYTPATIARARWNLDNDGGQQITAALTIQNAMVGNILSISPSAFHAVIFGINPDGQNPLADYIVDFGNAGTKNGSLLLPNPGHNGAQVTDIIWNQLGITIGPNVNGSFVATGGLHINAGNATNPITMTGIPSVNGSAGVSCSGTPTSSFASVNGIVTHC